MKYSLFESSGPGVCMQQENVVMLNCLFLPTGLVAGGWWLDSEHLLLALIPNVHNFSQLVNLCKNENSSLFWHILLDYIFMLIIVLLNE